MTGTGTQIIGRRVLLTGASGFLGYYVQSCLSDLNFHVMSPSSARCDLRDHAAALDLFSSIRPDIVVHCAARVGGIGLNQSKPADLFYDNITMGVNVIDCCQVARVKKLVLIGTVCSYPEYTPVPFSERYLWHGYPEPTNAAYGISKRAVFDMASWYRTQYGLNAVCLIPTNLYGPGDNFDPFSSHVIPAMIQKFYEAKLKDLPSVTLWGDGSPTRDFLYVEDAARAIGHAVERYDGYEPVNLGSGHEISIRDLAAKVSTACGYTGAILWDKSKPNGQLRRRLDTSLAARYLGWYASTDFGTGLHNTVFWYEQNVANSNTANASIAL